MSKRNEKTGLKYLSISAMDTLLKLGMYTTFKREALKQPVRWGGPWPDEESAKAGFSKFLKHANKGCYYWLERTKGEWYIMGRLIDTEPMTDKANDASEK